MLLTAAAEGSSKLAVWAGAFALANTIIITLGAWKVAALAALTKQVQEHSAANGKGISRVEETLNGDRKKLVTEIKDLRQEILVLTAPGVVPPGDLKERLEKLRAEFLTWKRDRTADETEWKLSKTADEARAKKLLDNANELTDLILAIK